MAEFIAEPLLPLVLLVALPLVAVGLRAGAKAVRRFTRASKTPADDQLGEVAGNALDGAADAIDPKEGK